LGGCSSFWQAVILKQIGGLLIIAFVAVLGGSSVSLTGQQRVSPILLQVSKTRCRLHIMCAVLSKPSSMAAGSVWALDNSQSKVTGLPVPPTDSIYAVVVEELGWFGSVALIGLYGFLVWRGLVIARRAPDMLGTLLASGW
jgi:cell division protein FtsW (lipid II flippase)